MLVKEQIEKYIPYNEQEIKDKEMILKYCSLFDDVLTRSNEIVHFTCSGFVLNEKKDKVLMIYHNIYNTWAWPGGHADGETDFLSVAIREVQEETGVNKVTPIVKDIFSLETLPVAGHVKHGKYVPSHIHISVSYLLEVSENETLKIKEDENSNVGWLPLNTFLDTITEEHSKPIYRKIIEKAELNLV
ncbi:MAG: NUDIX hydrolase [Bacilli bacterium]|nr:NUDIX hydrolase [Bacilli bacterium]